MDEPTHGSPARMSDDEIARSLVFSAGFGLLEAADLLAERFGGMNWKPPSDRLAAVDEVDTMVQILDTALLQSRQLLLRAVDYPDEPDLEAFKE